MSRAFLPEARKLVFLGEAGCGKSEIAVQLALELAAQGRAVHFFDLDQTKPLMRSRDEEKTVILDVGGNDTGARLIGVYAHLLRDADVWFVVNPYRPWSGTVEHIDGILSAVLRASRLRMPRFLLNPNLGRDTTAREYLDGLAQGLAMLMPYAAVEAAAVPDSLHQQVRAHTDLPLLCITPRITVPEAGLDE